MQNPFLPSHPITERKQFVSCTRYQGGQGYEFRYQTPGIKEVRDMSSDIRHQVLMKSEIWVLISDTRYRGSPRHEYSYQTPGIKKFRDMRTYYKTPDIKEVRDMRTDIRHQVSRRSKMWEHISETRYQEVQGCENIYQTPDIKEVRNISSDIRHQV